MMKTAEIKVSKNVWLETGVSTRLALGFSIDRHYINLDILCFFFTIQL